MKDKILIGIILLLFLTLFIETAYLLKIKTENHLKQTTSNNIQNNNLSLFKRRNNILLFDNILRKSLDPFSDIEDFENILNNNLNVLSLSPTFNRFENEKEYIIRGHVPNINGMISVNIENNALIVSGEQKTKNEEKHDGFYKMQSSFNSFNKMIPLPDNIKISEIKTEYKDECLIITIPKSDQALGSGKLKLKYKEL